jgi:hypothetical protein
LDRSGTFGQNPRVGLDLPGSPMLDYRHQRGEIMYKVVNLHNKYQVKKDYYEKFIWTKGGIAYTVLGIISLATILALGFLVTSSLFMALIAWLFVMSLVGIIACSLTGNKFNPVPHTIGFCSDYVEPKTGHATVTIILLKGLLERKELEVFNDPEMVAEEVFNKLKLHNLNICTDDEITELNDLLRKLIVKCDEAKYRSLYKNVSSTGAIETALVVAEQVEQDLI